MRLIKIVHVIKDDIKFYQSVIDSFKNEKRFDNYCVLVVRNKKKAFSSIPYDTNITVLYTTKMIRDYFIKSDYDLVFFHSLSPERWNIVKCIPKDKNIIWWAFGYEIYESCYGMKPLIPINLYKERTLKIKKRIFSLSELLKNCIRNTVFYLYHVRYKNQFLARIKYFQPVLANEIDMMRLYNPTFSAVEFYPYICGEISDLSKIFKKKDEGLILLGHSATYTNNHADLFDLIKQRNLISHKYIIPVNYGDRLYAQYLIKHYNNPNFYFIKDWMDSKHYFEVLNKCSYYISGVIRQQGLGNIWYALTNGIKVFLYKDSVVYKYLKSFGFIVYPIEDICDKELSTALTLDEAKHNILLFNKEVRRRKRINEIVISEIIVDLNPNDNNREKNVCAEL